MSFDDASHLPATRHRHGPVSTYEVLVEDFDRIEQEATTVGTDLQFAIFWLSEAITSSVALPTIPNGSIHIFDFFLIAMFAGYGFGVYFLRRWSKQKNSLKRLMDRIRESQVGPMGEQGKELRPSEVASLPASGPVELTVAPAPLAVSPSVPEVSVTDPVGKS
jgi:hypothetical protein